MLNKIDSEILRELSRNSKRRLYQLADILDIPRSTLHNRIKKLEKAGIIKTYKAIIDYKKVGKPITAFVHIVITSRQSAEEIADKIKKMSEVEEVHIISGQFDLIAKVRFTDAEHLGRFIFDKVSGLRSNFGVERTESMIVLKTKKDFGLEMDE